MAKSCKLSSQNCYTTVVQLDSKYPSGTRNRLENLSRKLRITKMSEIKALKENFRT